MGMEIVVASTFRFLVRGWQPDRVLVQPQKYRQKEPKKRLRRLLLSRYFDRPDKRGFELVWLEPDSDLCRCLPLLSPLRCVVDSQQVTVLYRCSYLATRSLQDLKIFEILDLALIASTYTTYTANIVEHGSLEEASETTASSFATASNKT
jgi:hypothetical protein